MLFPAPFIFYLFYLLFYLSACFKEQILRRKRTIVMDLPVHRLAHLLKFKCDHCLYFVVMKAKLYMVLYRTLLCYRSRVPVAICFIGFDQIA